MSAASSPQDGQHYARGVPAVSPGECRADARVSIRSPDDRASKGCALSPNGGAQCVKHTTPSGAERPRTAIVVRSAPSSATWPRAIASADATSHAPDAFVCS